MKKAHIDVHFTRNITETETFSEVPYGYQIDLKQGEESAEYEVRLELHRDDAVEEKVYQLKFSLPTVVLRIPSS